MRQLFLHRSLLSTLSTLGDFFREMSLLNCQKYPTRARRLLDEWESVYFKVSLGKETMN
jgi:hypothetical protein